MTEGDGLHKRSGSRFWWVSYQGPDGQVRESSKTADRRTALAYRKQRLAQVANGTWSALDKRRDSMPTVQQYAEDFAEKRRRDGVLTVKDETTRLRSYVVPHIGQLHLDQVKRKHIADMMGKVAREPGKKTAKLSPRSVLHVYGVTRLLFDQAVADELLVASPCTLRTKRGELPEKRDKDPKWRVLNRYTREETEQLISDQRIPIMRRTFYGLLLLAGLRSGEAIGLTWSVYDAHAEGLGQLLVATQYDGRDLKTASRSAGSTRVVPVHPMLAALLAEWKLSGFAFQHGRPPRHEDYLVPSPLGPTRHLSKKTLEWLKADLDMLKLRSKGRGRHACRHTFISLAQAGGAPRDVLETITHEGTDRRAIAGYTVYPWETLCEAVLCLKIERREGKVLPLKRSETP